MATFVAAALCVAGGRTAQAQFLSPGALTRAHEQLEGVTNCTSCHTVGGRGVDRAKCLERLDQASDFRVRRHRISLRRCPVCSYCYRNRLVGPGHIFHSCSHNHSTISEYFQGVDGLLFKGPQHGFPGRLCRFAISFPRRQHLHYRSHYGTILVSGGNGYHAA